MKYTDLLDVLAKDTIVELVRSLILLHTIGADRAETGVEGITKLATLDFLLANPVYLKQALERTQRSTKHLNLEHFEEERIATRSAHFNFEPWDFEHRRLIGRLLAMKLVSFSGIGTGPLRLYLTELGAKKATDLSKQTLFNMIAQRAKLVVREFNLQPENLQRKIAKLLPELFTLNDPIESAA